MTRLTARSTAGLFQRAAPAFEAHWDYELAGAAAPASIMQLEGVLRVVPDDERILVQLARAYASYAYGWIEDRMEQCPVDDQACQDHWATRARWMYLRARDLALEVLRQRDDGIDAARRAGLVAFERWLRDAYDEPEDAPALLWAGYAWGAAIAISLEDPELVADLGLARALVRRSVELDPTYANAAGLTFLGYAEAGLPEALGGNPQAGREHFERALQVTGRRALLVHVNYAKAYAVAVGDRALFEQLLREVLDAGDHGDAVRLANKVARRRAARYLAAADQWF